MIRSIAIGSGENNRPGINNCGLNGNFGIKAGILPVHEISMMNALSHIKCHVFPTAQGSINAMVVSRIIGGRGVVKPDR